jgi:7-carboxy-7-deazaguanine synthase
LNVSEIFYSIQGEGRYGGVPSVFVRLAGCDLRCRWCDTPYALQTSQGKPMTIDRILAQVETYDCPHVVVTGGEPLIAPELPDFLRELNRRGMHITVETSATQFREIICDLISISPKLSNSTPPDGPDVQSHQQRRLNIIAIGSFIDRCDYQLKFVVEKESDLAEIDELLNQLHNIDKNKILLMPQARTKTEYNRLGPRIAQMCIDKGFRYCPRLQIELWGNRRRR